MILYVNEHYHIECNIREIKGKRALNANRDSVLGLIPLNTASIALHRTMGFEHAGTLRQIGFKFGGWLDLDLYQLILKTPINPVDG